MRRLLLPLLAALALPTAVRANIKGNAVPKLTDDVNTKYKKCINRMIKTKPQLPKDFSLINYSTMCFDFVYSFQSGRIENANKAINHVLAINGLNSKGIPCSGRNERWLEIYPGVFDFKTEIKYLGCKSLLDIERYAIMKKDRLNNIYKNNSSRLKIYPYYCHSNFYNNVDFYNDPYSDKPPIKDCSSIRQTIF